MFAHHEKYPSNYTLLIIQVLADPNYNLVPAVAFLLHPHVWKKVSIDINCKKRDVQAYTRVSVPPEDDDTEEGFIIKPIFSTVVQSSPGTAIV